MVNTSVNLCGIQLDNPIIPASGTFGYGYEFAELYDINCLGTFSFKDTENEDGYAYITTQDALYMVVTASGNLRKARSFIKEFQTDDYKDLIPYL